MIEIRRRHASTTDNNLTLDFASVPKLHHHDSTTIPFTSTTLRSRGRRRRRHFPRAATAAASSSVMIMRLLSTIGFTVVAGAIITSVVYANFVHDSRRLQVEMEIAKNGADFFPIPIPDPPVSDASVRQQQQQQQSPSSIIRSHSRQVDSQQESVQLPSNVMIHDDDNNPNRNLEHEIQQIVSSSLPLPRLIRLDDADLYQQERDHLLQQMDVPLEGDGLAKFQRQEDLPLHQLECRRVAWQHLQFPVCNIIHEFSTLERPVQHSDNNHWQQDYEITYRGFGEWRSTWLYTHAQHNNNNESFVWKAVHHGEEYFQINYQLLWNIHRDAIIHERLTSSPHIVDIYGYCGVTVISEHMLGDLNKEMLGGDGGYLELQELLALERHDVHPMNNLTARQKLDIAVEMAQAIAAMHGFTGGVIVHADIHHEQWLRSKTGRVKLNDFNNAEILEFCADCHAYCTVYRDFYGTYRSPEELRFEHVTETLDVYTFGHAVYTLLTGLLPFYEYPEEWDPLTEQIAYHRLRPFVDPRYRKRSKIESRLVEIMEECWEFNPRQRLSIFQVLQKLVDFQAEIEMEE